MKPNEEQIKEFWEWCEFKWRTYASAYAGEVIMKVHDATWVHPDGETHFNLPPIDLSNLFKYAVPRLNEKGCCVTLQAYGQKGHLAFVSESVFPQRGSDGYDPYFKRIAEYEDEDPAIALFWAIYKVMDKI